MSTTETLAKYLDQQTNYLTVNHLSFILGMSRYTIANWSSSGLFPQSVVGTPLRFDPHEVACWVRESRYYPLRGLGFRLTLWAEAHLFASQGSFTPPHLLKKALASIGYDWLDAFREAADESPSALSNSKFHLLDAFREAMDTLDVQEQRTLLHELQTHKFSDDAAEVPRAKESR